MELMSKQLEQIKKQYRLSPRETQIVELILQGVDSNEKMTKILGLHIGTTRRYVHDLYGKMGTSTKLSIALKIINSIHK